MQSNNQTIICGSCGKSRGKNIDKCPACGSTKVRTNELSYTSSINKNLKVPTSYNNRNSDDVGAGTYAGTGARTGVRAVTRTGTGNSLVKIIKKIILAKKGKTGNKK